MFAIQSEGAVTSSSRIATISPWLIAMPIFLELAAPTPGLMVANIVEARIAHERRERVTGLVINALINDEHLELLIRAAKHAAYTLRNSLRSSLGRYDDRNKGHRRSLPY